jgi:hypothetical protein
METLALYEQGKKMPLKRYQLAQRVIDWRTYILTIIAADRFADATRRLNFRR